MILTYAEQRKYTVYLREFLKKMAWQSFTMHCQTAQVCLLGRCACSRCVTHHASIKKLERDIKNGNSQWPAAFAKQPFNIWRSMHTRAAPYIRHPVEQELHGSRRKRRILQHGGLQEGREKPLQQRASEAAAAAWTACEN